MPVAPVVPHPGFPHRLSEESGILQLQPPCPAMESSLALKAGEIVKGLCPVSHQKTQLSKTVPFLMGHQSGEALFLETLPNT